MDGGVEKEICYQ